MILSKMLGGPYLGIISLMTSMGNFPQFWILISVSFENVHFYNIYVRHTHIYLKSVLNVLVNQNEIFENFLVAQVVHIYQTSLVL